ncbi:MAG: hypothetical protein RLZ12_958 [Bacillota bacterium]|jgi:hypothetical protein
MGDTEAINYSASQPNIHGANYIDTVILNQYDTFAVRSSSASGTPTVAVPLVIL